MENARFLVIQTASIGDAILVTPVLEALHSHFPEASIGILVKSGMEGLFTEHPYISKIHIWNKKQHKYRNLFRLIREIRKEHYNLIINAQRFFSTGMIAVLSGAGATVGFDKNPWSRFFTRRIPHQIGDAAVHETDRNLSLIAHLGIKPIFPVRLYPDKASVKNTLKFKEQPYITVSPASLWPTKQLPEETWTAFLQKLSPGFRCYILGSKADSALAQRIMKGSVNEAVIDLTGKLSLLESAALMQDAVMNYSNDSAPMHLASAVNAPVTAIFCSTVPAFGFGPRSQTSHIVECQEDLSCRPCGLHGRKRCPEKHYKCGKNIDPQILTDILHHYAGRS
ncbi:MAG TPA: glycosyltransferase family 9 protein [Bacteroidales bacterium]|nr:glycosyltransferase family 9 protein [Bacteroidales bacterium]HRZ49086.1 glycosyltransferase family 9 protein [Bacteroidales bacterium]